MNRIIAFCKRNYYLLTSLLMFLSFPTYDIWFLKGFPFFAWIAMVPLFMYVRDKKVKDIYLTSFITGLLGHFLAFEWIGNFGAAAPGGLRGHRGVPDAGPDGFLLDQDHPGGDPLPAVRGAAVSHLSLGMDHGGLDRVNRLHRLSAPLLGIHPVSR